MAHRVLIIIEDNPDGRFARKVMLSLAGMVVDAAEDGLVGVARALSWRPDVAIVDIGLPELDGFGVAARLREAFGEKIVLIAMSGYGQADVRDRAYREGFHCFFTRPVGPGGLVSIFKSTTAQNRPKC